LVNVEAPQCDPAAVGTADLFNTRDSADLSVDVGIAECEERTVAFDKIPQAKHQHVDIPPISGALYA